MFTNDQSDFGWLWRRLGVASFQLGAGGDQRYYGLLTIEECAQAMAAVYRDHYLLWL